MNGKIIDSNTELSNRIEQLESKIALQETSEQDLVTKSKVYSNDEYGYEIEYPDTWITTTEANGSVFFIYHPEGEEIASMTIRTIALPAGNPEKPKMDKLEIAGQEVVRNSWSENRYYFELAVADSDPYQVWYNYSDEQTEQLFSKILSSFSFIEN